VVERGSRDVGNGGINGAVDGTQLMQHVGGALASRAAPLGQILG